jgi:hypothetical protein
MYPWGRDECTKPRQEGVARHRGKGGTELVGMFEQNPDGAIGHGPDGIMRESGAVQRTDNAFEPTAVATVDSHRGVQLHAVGTDEQGARRGVVVERERSRVAMTERNAGRDGGIDVDLVVEVKAGEIVMDAVEDTGEVMGF